MTGFDKIRNFPEKNRTVLAYLDEPVLITDPKGVLVYLNPRGEVDFGIEMRIAIGRSINEVLPDAIAKSLLQGLGRMEKNSAALRFPITESAQKYSAHLNPILKEQRLTGVIIFLRPELDQEVISRLNMSLFSTLHVENDAIDIPPRSSCTISLKNSMGGVPIFSVSGFTRFA